MGEAKVFAEQRSTNLTPLGERIFFDRYAKKDRDQIPEIGQLVVVAPDTESRKRELAQVVAVTLSPTELHQVSVKTLTDGRTIVFPIDQVDIPVEQFEDAAARIAEAVAEAEPQGRRAWWTLTFKNLLKNRAFVPAGRVWAGAGIEQFLTPYNCFVIAPPKDSRGGIIHTLGEMTEVMSRGGGVGIPLMTLRPRHSVVRGVNGRSSGSVHWSEIYSFVTNLIEQGGSRRGALMLIQYCWHPDVLDFIDYKTDPKKLEGANVSVGITDAFMAAVEADENWDLVFPDTSHPSYDTEWEGDLDVWRDKGLPVQVYKTVKARDVWKRILDRAWSSAEPGLFFVDRYNKMSNSWYYQRGKIFCSNPCLTGDTRLATQYGLVPIAELARNQLSLRVTTDSRVEPDYKVSSTIGVALREAVPAFMTAESAEVFYVETRHGYRLRATAAHKFVTPTGFSELQHLQVGDELMLQSAEGQWGTEGSAALGMTIGWMMGDGYWSGSEAVFRFYGEKRAIAESILDRARSILPSGFTMNSYPVDSIDAVEACSASMSRVLAEYGFTADTKQTIPEVIWRGTRETVIAYLRGFFAADGQINCSGADGSLTCSARYSQSNPELLRDVQTLLLNLGIVSALYLRREAGMRRLPNGKGGMKDYFCEAQYDLAIAKVNLARFAEIVGFERPEHDARYSEWAKNRKRVPYRETFVDEIVKIESAGMETVYCTTQPSHHTIIANGVVTGQCGEQGIPRNAVCNLGHLNLPMFLVGDGMVDPASVDWSALKMAVRTAVRFMDDVIDVAFTPLEENITQQKGERRIGLGTMGLGEMLIRMHIRYGNNPECLKFIDSLYKTICCEAYKMSVELAKEKGSFEWFDAEKFLQSGFASQLPDEIRDAIREHGLRNVTLLTQAPTGTVGTMMNTSTGIEPYPWWAWERTSRIGTHLEKAVVYEQYLETHPEVKTLREGLSVRRQATSDVGLPYWFVSSATMTPEDHAYTQAAIQRWTDSSISKTSNLPSDYTPEQVGQYYELLYKLGCKGGTVYRDKSRDVQVLNIPEAPKVEAAPAKALNPIPEDVYDLKGVMVQTPAGKLSVKFGLDPNTNKPFEVWLELSRAGTALNGWTEALARVMSLVLRVGGSASPEARVDMLIKQLAGIGGGDSVGFGPRRVLSVPDAVATGLSKLMAKISNKPSDHVVADDSFVEVKADVDICPECHQSSLFRTEGCTKCTSCSFSKC